ncbi:MAG: MEDS domain-containing protein [Acidobacteriota bacterium]
MEAIPRHQCLVYDGAPSLHLPALARVLRDKLQQNYRCLYMNSRPMVAGMQSYLAMEGVEVENVIRKRRLLLSWEQMHLVNGLFDVDKMLNTLSDALQSALRDGYTGLWATGDMSWEMGPEKNLPKLLDYERRLDEFLEAHPRMGGVCQYRMDTMPRTAVQQGLVAHRALFINETLSILNPQYLHPEMSSPSAVAQAEPELALRPIWERQSAV